MFAGESPLRIATDIECRCKCCSKFSVEEKRTIMQQFNDLADHDRQNIYLRGCVTVNKSEKIRRRPRNEEPNTARNSFSYSITISDKTIKVCKAALCALHGISRARLAKKVLNFDVDITDGRGKHGNHIRLDDEIRNKVREHIRSFPARESHYSRSKNQSRKYLDSNLSISEMHRLLVKEYPNLERSAKYWLYEDLFNHEFNISFGHPRSDVCDTCEKLTADIAAVNRNKEKARAQQLKTEHEIHIRKGDAFTAQLQEVTELAQNDETIHVIAMDFQKNIPLPLTGIGQEYYKRQLWLHNLGIHDCVKNKATMFLYAEHYAGKGPNEVLSCLRYYIDNIPSSVKQLHIFADNCYSQNKNKYMLAYIESLANSRFQMVEMHYPIPGHSRMPCDRDFGRIEKRKKKEDRIIVPSEWIKLIKETDLKSPFTIVYVEHPLTDNMQPDGTPIVKVKDFKTPLDKIIQAPKGIAKVRGVTAKRGQALLIRNSMTGQATEKMPIFKRGIRLATVLATLQALPAAHTDFLPIKRPKYNDVQSLLAHVTLPPETAFYTFLKPVDSGRMEENEDERE